MKINLKKNVLDSSTIMESHPSEKHQNNDALEPYLVILSGQDQGKQFKLNRQQNTFGRGNDVHIVLSDPKISRHHGAFIIYPDGIVLEDAQSTNGTYIDDRLITRQKVDLMSRIRIGNTHLKIEYKKRKEVEYEQSIYRAAHIDPLTNTLNRGIFMKRAQEEFSFCQRNDAPLTIVLCDVDHFKRKNDEFGHLAGDHVLKTLGQIFTAEMRQEDLLGRYGGEEFIMLLRESSGDDAFQWGERLRNCVARHAFVFQGQAIPTTISIGIGSRQGHQLASLKSVIQIADEALYRAKRNGRNQVMAG